MRYKLVVIGTSYGGMEALRAILPQLPEDFPLPIAIVQHRSSDSDDYLATYLDTICNIRVKEADEKEPLLPGTAYMAPADYHLLVEEDRSLSLCVGERVHYSRPAVDVLFESAAFALGKGVIGVVLTGANHDGSRGLLKIKGCGGHTIAQSPETCVAEAMPEAAIATGAVDHILDLDEIGLYLTQLLDGTPAQNPQRPPGESPRR